MNEIIGTLILVDAAGLMHEYGLSTIKKYEENGKKVPIINLQDNKEAGKYIQMITQNKYAESGQGSLNLSLKAKPGDELRWWQADTNRGTGFECQIAKIAPSIDNYSQWNTWFENTPEPINDILNNNPQSSRRIREREQFWYAKFTDIKYHAKVKKRKYAYNGSVNLPYQIDINIIKTAGIFHENVHVCTFRWHPEVHIQDSYQLTSNNPEAFENQIATGLSDGDLLLSN